MTLDDIVTGVAVLWCDPQQLPYSMADGSGAVSWHSASPASRILLGEGVCCTWVEINS